MRRQGENHLAAGMLDPQIEGASIGESFSRDRYDLVTVGPSEFNGPVGRARVHQDDLHLDRLVAKAAECSFDCLFLVLGAHHDARRSCRQGCPPLLRRGSAYLLPLIVLPATQR